MAIAEARPRDAAVRSGPSPLEVVGYIGLALVVAWWAGRAFYDSYPWDTGLAYHGGQVAWATGHPERLVSWMSTPFLGAVMALLSRVVSGRGAAALVTALNLIAWVGAVSVVLHRTRRLLAPRWWWIAAFGLLSFAPLMSSVWFKQFNPIVLVLAAAGFELVRRCRVGWGAAAIGLSVAIKPMAILLPFVMLARRGTRRAGALALAWIVGLNVAAQGLMAIWAGNLATLDPLIEVRNFINKTKPNGIFTCLPSNFAPVTLLCRETGGIQHWTLQQITVWAALLLLGAWVVAALRGRRPTSWEVFAFTCPFSVMFSSLQWTHYQIMLAPLLFLLLFRFASEGAGPGAWAGLAIAFGLASLIWAPLGGAPYGSIFGAIQDVFGTLGRPSEPKLAEEFAQFAQYVVLLTGVFWYLGRPVPSERTVAGSPRAIQRQPVA